MIGLEQVSFGYGEKQETLSHVSATVARGECVLLCGASGCGKTTVTKLINGLIPAFTPGCRLEGQVMVNGLAPRETPMYELAQRVGSVFQNPKSQFFNLDTDSELAFGLENEGRPPEEIRRRVEQVAETLHLQDLRGKNIFSLSGGQKQLLAFGSVYAMGPEIYVLDEPTANLDQEAIARLHDQLAALKRQGCTIVVAEHRLYFLTDLIDRAFYLRSGVLERVFTGEQFRSLPDPEREALGLRTLTPAVCTLPSVESAGTKEGLSIEGLACAFRKEAPVFRDLSFSARPRRGGGDHRTQRRGQDHPFPLPLRAAERTSGTNSAEWKASGSKRPPAVGFLCHAGCKPSTVLRQRVGRVPDVRAGGI